MADDCIQAALATLIEEVVEIRRDFRHRASGERHLLCRLLSAVDTFTEHAVMHTDCSREHSFEIQRYEPGIVYNDFAQRMTGLDDVLSACICAKADGRVVGRHNCDATDDEAARVVEICHTNLKFFGNKSIWYGHHFFANVRVRNSRIRTPIINNHQMKTFYTPISTVILITTVEFRSQEFKEILQEMEEEQRRQMV